MDSYVVNLRNPTAVGLIKIKISQVKLKTSQFRANNQISESLTERTLTGNYLINP